MRVLFMLAVAAGLATNINSMKPEPKDNLASLWKEYEALDRADKPAQAAEKLKEIRTLAMEQRSPYYFYMAGTKYISAVESRNWKMKDSVRSEFASLVKEFDYPIVTYRWMNAYGDSRQLSLENFLEKNASRLKGDKNPSLWTISALNGVLQKHITDDYEFVLWHILFTHRTNSDRLDKYINEEYPKRAFLRYYTATWEYADYKRKPLMQKIVDDYPGTAISLYARESLLSIELGDLQRSKTATSKDYKAFYDKCQVFIKDKKALSGEEKTIAQNLSFAESTCKNLTSKQLTAACGGDSLQVRFRNLESANLTMNVNNNGKPGTQVGKWKVRNSVGSFYLIDTENVAIPSIDDGEYIVTAKSDKIESTCLYSHYTISLAHRRDADGYRVYAASWRSGKPLGSARFVLKKGDTVLKTTTLALDGWTLIPEEWTSLIEKDGDVYYNISCEYKDASGKMRRSPDLSINKPWWYDSSDPRDRVRGDCRIFKDRGAYNPGDTVKFKVILFKGNFIDQMDVKPGEEITVSLLNTESKVLETISLVTNSFGSASGSFVLPTDQKNGSFHLSVKSGTSTLGGDSFRVDEFVLPTFYLSFDPQVDLYLPGDRPKVSGKLTSYSGHSLAGAVIDFKVKRWNTVVHEATASPEEDGTFTQYFPAMSAGVYKVTAKVTDATGETLEFNDYLLICNSINVEITPLNGEYGTFVTFPEDTYYSDRYIYEIPRGRYYSDPKMIIRGKKASFTLNVKDADGNKVPGDVEYALVTEKGDTLQTGKARSGDNVDVDMSSCPDGYYTLKAFSQVKDRDVKDTRKCYILKQEGTVLDAPLRRFFVLGESEVLPGGDIKLFYGSADGPTWATVSVFGDKRQLLDSRLVELSGGRGEEGNTSEISIPYQENWPEAVRLVIFYFKWGREVSYDWQFTRKKTMLDMPLTFTSFTDKALPATKYTVSLASAPGVEAVASVFDKSLDAISPNDWYGVYLRSFSAPSIRTYSCHGRITGYNPDTGEMFMEEDSVDEFVTEANGRRLMKAGGAVEKEVMALASPVMDMEEASGATMDTMDEGADVKVRSTFSSALAFEPHLVADEEGRISFDFTTSDKLSTYYIKVFAHDRNMRNAQVEREVMVSIPVKVSIVEPGYMYEGDMLRPSISVSNNQDEPVQGKLMLYVYPGEEYESLKPSSVQSVPVTVPAKGEVAASFQVPAAGDCVGLKAVFVADKFSDAMFVKVPVKGLMQSLTESHSAVLLPGMSDKETLARLRKEFVNVKGSKAEYSEITLLDMVKDAIPSKKEPSGRDVLSLSEAYYVRLLSAQLEGKEAYDGELLGKIMACRNSDGGFGWFEGMSSSRMITAVMMERFARLAAAGFDVPDLKSSAKYLDKTHFNNKLPYWCGWISDAQYMYVRSLYSEVPFEEPSSKLLKEFRKEAVQYLTPSEKDGRGLKGRILDKARRLRTLQNLSASREGLSLAASWGVTTLTDSKLKSSLTADVESLLDYAVEHPDGGWYYPNAVMPWRGLLESEAYAHSLLSDLMDSVEDVPAGVKPRPEEVADGVRLWLMLQKETQKWGDDPAFVDAICSVMDASDEVLATKILILKAEYTKPFVEVKASGNGFTLAKEYYIERTVTDPFKDGEEKNVGVLEELHPGDKISVGDKIIAKYKVWSQENRSFIRLSATREACLRPVDQLSGRVGWWMRPLMVDGWYSLSPQGYRDVKTDRSEYWFDTYPEENTTVTEEFFVTQEGTFKAPVIEIESLYAPHYRANADYWGELKVEAAKKP